jgi:hypothetical protein
MDKLVAEILGKKTTLYTVITAYYDGTPNEVVAVEDASEARRLVIEEAKWEGTSWAGCPELDFARIGDFADDAIV